MSNFQIKVTNGNDVTFEDRYDGILYKIPAKGKVNLPYDAAVHIFGVDFENGQIDRDAIFTHLGRRWGWNRSFLKNKDEDKNKFRDQAKEMFEKIEFNVISMVMVETDVTEDGLVPAREDAPSGALSKFLSNKRLPKPGEVGAA